MKDKPTLESLQKRIRELEADLSDRERDLAIFRDELQRANSRLELFISQLSKDLKVMGQIQKTLVPTEFPNISGFEFSTKFVPGQKSGGDYFDIFEHEDKLRFGLVVAHSSGYSVSALLLSVLLKMTGQIEARRGTPPNQIIDGIAKELCPNLQKTDFANVLYCMVDRRNFDLNYCSVGNTVALHYTYANGQLKRLDNVEQPLQHDFTKALQSQSISLNPRDRVIFCTEGVAKVTNSTGEQFGEERLYRAVLGAPKVGVHELRNEILFQAQKFSGATEPDQDMTVVVLEVKDHVLKLAKQEPYATRR